MIRKIIAVVAGFVAASAVMVIVESLNGHVNLMLPPPLWFWIAGLAVFMPATIAGARLAPRAPATQVAAG
jgi:hypothetical protein